MSLVVALEWSKGQPAKRLSPEMWLLQVGLGNAFGEGICQLSSRWGDHVEDRDDIPVAVWQEEKVSFNNNDLPMYSENILVQIQCIGGS